MTKDGSFKRAVRQRARDTGQRYSQARADLQTARRQEFTTTRPFDRDDLKDHLEATYKINIAALAPIDDDPKTRPRGSWPGHYASTLFVRRADGEPWIARVFSSAADTVGRVEGDAEILRFLAGHGYPAERVATDQPVSVLDGKGVIVTQYIQGGRPADDHAVVSRELGGLLGRLHSLPSGGGAVARDGGAEETDGGFHVGRPKQDLAAAMSFLVSVEDELGPESRERFEWLRARVEEADDAEGLPEALTHSNFHYWSAVGCPGDLAIVGWAGSGRGPRLPALAWLLRTAGEAGPEHPEFVEAVLDGYTEHIQLTTEELERLPAILNLKSLWLACLEFRMSVRNGTEPGTGWRHPESFEYAARLADLVIARLGR
ncbi:hypothetical protein GCM10011575_28470 [Microlunatus endophyticus]|uniref:Uncharacterized protein n=1 Tax=Microlunatus endophyticus TaxID=1716077 RepID=A0A917SAP4_9ACTN|nr:phosphotransferase [Microlunatus endophyticus]GGL68239.1 hypothetical protein GCM10011575_28470 [Microlunatus endophyticus]